ncbi:MAG: sulfurtransferase TusA family protein [Rikenellaceae bacterium]|jgi:sulfite reductase (ferredoxin)|nr:sulfurtransferase TusA family protein [Rikenellaceae bacterium]
MYTLPDTLQQDVDELGRAAESFARGELEAGAFKIRRVPMGVYEQRRDGSYMVRIRTTGGVITPSQLMRIAAIARDAGSTLLHITTRQEIQVQNLSLERIEPVLKELQLIGLSSKGGGGNTVRNIMVSPCAGVDPQEAFDPTPHSITLTSKLIAEKDSFTLPRKLKIAFANSDAATDYAAVNDLGLVARLRNGQRGFKVYLGGSVASNPTVGWVVSEFIPEQQLFAVAEAAKRLFSDHGNRRNRHKARLRYIFYNLGEVRTLQLFDEYFREALKTSPEYRHEELAAQAVMEYRSNDIGFGPGFLAWERGYTAPQRQPGLRTVRIPVIHGNITLDDDVAVERLNRLLRFVGELGGDTLRFTPRQSLLLRNIPAAALPELHDLVKEQAPYVAEPLPVNDTVSCTGADTCRLGICLSKGLSAALRRRLLKLPEARELTGLRINISGCPNSCGQQAWADLGFSGKTGRNDRLYPAYRIHAGARRGEKPRLARSIADIAAKDIPAFTVRLLSDYASKREAYPLFADYIDAEGERLIERLASEYADVPPFDEDKNYYFDWGADELFTVAGRGVAECSAGLFDMIDIDRAAIEQAREQLSKEIEPRAMTELYYRILFSSARMLLVTRGAEPKSESEAFTLFDELFIDSNLIDSSFRDLVRLAAKHRDYPFGRFREQIEALASAVGALYDTMDDSLQFKNIAPAAALAPVRTDAPVVERRFKDLRGVACPMNFVQTKIILSQMKLGEILEILLDDGQPIANVPGSVRGEGHEVLEELRAGEHWKVMIKKRSNS